MGKLKSLAPRNSSDGHPVKYIGYKIITSRVVYENILKVKKEVEHK